MNDRSLDGIKERMEAEFAGRFTFVEEPSKANLSTQVEIKLPYLHFYSSGLKSLLADHEAALIWLTSQQVRFMLEGEWHGRPDGLIEKRVRLVNA